MPTNRGKRNRVLVPEAKKSLEDFKLEMANELRITSYDNLNIGELPSRQDGYVGGYMVKKIIEQYERSAQDK